MISPTDKLLLWLALLLPFAALGGVAPFSAPLCLGLFLLLGIAATLDAHLGRNVANGLAVRLPPVIRLTKGRPGALPLEIRNDGQQSLQIHIGLPLPQSIEVEQDPLDVRLPGGHALSATQWPCLAHERGSANLRECFFHVRSPLGLWLVRGRTPCETEVRTYPDLTRDRKQMASLFLNRGAFGIHTQRVLGQGREFEKLRHYLPGDSFEDIHWKATAKRGYPVTKLYQVERTQEVYVLIDTSRLSRRMVGAEPALERFIRAALVLGMAAERQGDRFGLLTFGNRIRHFIRAGGGNAHHAACRDALYRLSPESGTTDFEELFSFVRLRLRRRALLLILTDLSDPVLAQDFARTVEHVCRQHLVIVTMIQEEGVGPLFAVPDVVAVDDLYERLGDHLIWETLQEMGRRLRLLNVQLSSSSQERLTPDLVSQYMRVKARQVL